MVVNWWGVNRWGKYVVLLTIILLLTVLNVKAEVADSRPLYLYYFETVDKLLKQDETQSYQFTAFPDEKITIAVYGLDGLVLPELTLYNSEGELQASGQSMPEQPYVSYIEFTAASRTFADANAGAELFTFTVKAVEVAAEALADGGLVRVMIVEGDAINGDLTYLDTVNPLLPGRVFMVAGSDEIDRDVTETEVGLRTGAEVLAVERFREKPDIFVSRGSPEALPPVAERFHPDTSHSWFNQGADKFYFFTVHATPEQITTATDDQEANYRSLNLLTFFYYDYFFIIGAGSDPVLFTQKTQPCSEVTLENRVDCERVRVQPNPPAEEEEPLGVDTPKIITGSECSTQWDYDYYEWYDWETGEYYYYYYEFEHYLCFEYEYSSGSFTQPVVGTGGNDLLFGGNGNNEISGGGGDDIIFGDHYYREGCTSYNYYYYNYTFYCYNYFEASGTGDDILDGGAGGDIIYGGGGNDIIAGGTGNDWLIGDNVASYTYCGAEYYYFDINPYITWCYFSSGDYYYGLGNDTFIESPDDGSDSGDPEIPYITDTIQGGYGRDTVDYSSYNTNMSFSIYGYYDWWWYGDWSIETISNTVTGSFTETDYIYNVENYISGAGDDYFYVSGSFVYSNISAPVGISGGAGTDTVEFVDGTTGYFLLDDVEVVCSPPTNCYSSVLLSTTYTQIAPALWVALAPFAAPAPLMALAEANAETWYVTGGVGSSVDGGSGDDIYLLANSSASVNDTGEYGMDSVAYAVTAAALTLEASDEDSFAITDGSTAATLEGIENISTGSANDIFLLHYNPDGVSNTFDAGENATNTDMDTAVIASDVNLTVTFTMNTVTVTQTDTASTPDTLVNFEAIETGAGDDTFVINTTPAGYDLNAGAGLNSITYTTDANLIVYLDTDTPASITVSDNNAADTLTNFDTVTTGSGDDVVNVDVNAAGSTDYTINAGSGFNIFNFIFGGDEPLTDTVNMTVTADGTNNVLDFSGVDADVTIDTTSTTAQEVFTNFWLTIQGVFEVVFGTEETAIAEADTVASDDNFTDEPIATPTPLPEECPLDVADTETTDATEAAPDTAATEPAVSDCETATPEATLATVEATAEVTAEAVAATDVVAETTVEATVESPTLEATPEPTVEATATPEPVIESTPEAPPVESSPAPEATEEG